MPVRYEICETGTVPQSVRQGVRGLPLRVAEPQLRLGHRENEPELFFRLKKLMLEDYSAAESDDGFPIKPQQQRQYSGVPEQTGMEVHFFDRLKALTTLFEKSSEADGKNAAASLLAALGGTGDADDAV